MASRLGSLGNAGSLGGDHFVQDSVVGLELLVQRLVIGLLANVDGADQVDRDPFPLGQASPSNRTMPVSSASSWPAGSRSIRRKCSLVLPGSGLSAGRRLPGSPRRVPGDARSDHPPSPITAKTIHPGTPFVDGTRPKRTRLAADRTGRIHVSIGHDRRFGQTTSRWIARRLAIGHTHLARAPAVCYSPPPHLSTSWFFVSQGSRLPCTSIAITAGAQFAALLCSAALGCSHQTAEELRLAVGSGSG